MTALAGFDRAVKTDTLRWRQVEIDDTGQCPRPIGAAAGATNDMGVGDGVLGHGGPDDPAAEGIVLRDAVQHHQGATGAGRGDGAQGQALDGRVGGQAGRAAKQRGLAVEFQGLVDRIAAFDAGCVDIDRAEGLVAAEDGKAVGADDDLGRFRRMDRRGGGEGCDNQAIPVVHAPRSGCSAETLQGACKKSIRGWFPPVHLASYVSFTTDRPRKRRDAASHGRRHEIWGNLYR